MNTEIDEQAYYRTSDLPLAGVITLYLPIEMIDKTNPKRVEFIFKRNTYLDQLIEAYWKRELKVEPQAFSASVKAIKSRLYSQ